MDILYRLGSATAAEIKENLPDAPSYSAVRSLLRILEDKGHLRHQYDGPRYVFTPIVTRPVAQKSALKQIVIVKQTYSTGVNLAKCLALPGTALAAKTTGETCVPLTLAEVQRNFKDADRLIDNVASAFPPSITIDPKLLFCPGEPCTTSGEDGLFFRDPDHATNAGSLFLIGRAKDILLPRLNRP